jgi:hypothetical protein
MLRYLVLVLVLVNAAFWAWTQGWLDAVVGANVRADGQHEPQRLQRQSHVDQVVMLPANAPARSSSQGSSSGRAGSDAASATPASPPSAAEASASPEVPPPAGLPASSSVASPAVRTFCVEAGPFQGSEYAGVETAIKKLLKPGSWQTQSVAVPGLWLVYMGPYPDDDQLDKKQTELRRIRGLNFEEVRTPTSLAQGISLGRYNQEAEAETALVQLRNRGVRTARVVNARPAMTVQLLRVPEADEATQVKLTTLKLPQDKGFVACRS